MIYYLKVIRGRINVKVWTDVDYWFLTGRMQCFTIVNPPLFCWFLYTIYPFSFIHMVIRDKTPTYLGNK